MKKYLLLSVMGLFLFSCKEEQTSKLELNKLNTTAFGSNLDISYTGDTIAKFESQLQAFLADFNTQLSTYDEHSVISKLNRNEIKEVEDLNFALLQKSIYLNILTNGAFDVSVAPLVDLWGFGEGGPTEVDSAKVDSARALVGKHNFVLVDGEVLKANPGVRFNYNAIAPGYAADLLSEMMERNGSTNYYINVGGEIRCSGVNQDSLFWLIGIEKPTDNKTGQNSAMRYIRVKNQSLATSGNYRKYYEKDGKRYAHTIDPRTGYPVQHDLLSATVLAPEAALADALATACMVLGREDAKTLLSTLEGVSYYFIYTNEQGEFLEEWSPGLEEQFEVGE